MIGTAAKWGAALAVAVGGVALASIKDAAEAEASLAQLDAVLKSTGGTAGVTRKQLTDMADGLEKTTKFSAESTQAAQALLLTFTNIGKDTFPRATKTALDMATALGGDAAGQSIALGKALNDPIKGITALTKVGVSFTEGQKASIKAMQEHGDMAGAQKIILDELAKEFGGSAEAAGKTFAGQLIIAKNAMGNVKETLGTMLLPKLTEFLNWVTPHLPAIGDFFTKAFDVIGKVLNTVGTYVKENIIPAFKEFYAWIAPHIPAIKQFIVDNFNANIEILKKFWAFIKENILPIVKEFYDWIKPYIPAIRQFIVDAFTKVTEVFKVVADFVKEHVIPAFKLLKEKFDEYFPKIKDAVMKAYDYLKPHFDKLVDIIKKDLMPIIMGLWDTFKKAWPGIQSIFEIVFPIIVGIIGTVMDTIGVLIKIVKGIYDFIKPALDKVADIFSTVFGGIKKLIDGVQWVLDKFNGTPMKDKSSTVTTNYKDTGSTGPLTKSHNAAGTDFWQGGETWVNEVGGEIIDLPTGSRVIPHDVSMEMARNSGKNNNNNNNNGTNGGLNFTVAGDFINNRKEDIEELMEEFEMFRQMKFRALGGTT